MQFNMKNRLKKLEAENKPLEFEDYTIFFEDVPYEEEDNIEIFEPLHDFPDEVNEIVYEHYIKGKNHKAPVLFLEVKDAEFIISELKKRGCVINGGK